jgi:hypothetical protein
MCFGNNIFLSGVGLASTRKVKAVHRTATYSEVPILKFWRKEKQILKQSVHEPIVERNRQQTSAEKAEFRIFNAVIFRSLLQ